MILDGQTRLSDAQAFSATGATTNYYDGSAADDMARGEPMALVFTVTTAADSTTGDETYAFAVQSDSDSAFGTVQTLVSAIVAAANLAIGDRVVLPIRPGAQRYIRGYLTLGGTTPSVSVDCDLLPLESAGEDYNVTYPSGYTI